MIDKELFNEGIKTIESELSDVKRQQWHWNKGHKVNTRKFYLSLNATMLTLKFLTNEAVNSEICTQIPRYARYE